MELKVYCPSCGETSKSPVLEDMQISPGSDHWTCPKCKTKWNVIVQFFEVPKKNDPD